MFSGPAGSEVMVARLDNSRVHVHGVKRGVALLDATRYETIVRIM